MSEKESQNQVNGWADRATEGQNEELASSRAQVQTCESDSGGSLGNLDDSSVASSPLQLESLISGQISSPYDKLPTTSLAERDRIHLSRIFPEEVWHLIFDQLDNSADLENVSNSSLYFRDLLSSQRVNFLFHNVWNYFGELFYFNYACRGNIYDIVIPPNFHKPSGNHDNTERTVGGKADWYKEIVKLRLVSRTWNTAIDNFYQNHPIHFRLQNQIHRSQDTFTRFIHINNGLSNFHQQRHENLLLRHFASTHANTSRNPFLGRYVRIKFQSGHDENFINGILGVLLEYGHHIWYCRIAICDFASTTECYSRIWEVVQLMPNLKILRLDNWQVDYNRTPSAKESFELHAEINLRPMPNLNKLQMLSTTDLPPPIFLELISRNGHLSTLDVDRNNSRYGYKIFKLPLPNLKKLAISFYSEASFLKMSGDSVNWPLTELDLDLASTSTFIDWQTVFNVLQKFENTLTQLDLKLPVALNKADKDQIYREGHTYRLNLPLVTSLTLEMRNVSCLDFLLPIKDSLTRLVVEVVVKDHEKVYRHFKNVEAGQGRVVKFLNSARRLWNTSNVWTLFPKLNDVWLCIEPIGSGDGMQYYENRRRWQDDIKWMQDLSSSDWSE